MVDSCIAFNCIAFVALGRRAAKVSSKLSSGWHNHLTLIGLELSSLRGREYLNFRINLKIHLR